MSDKDLARRAMAEVAFDGVNITNSIRPYLLALTYVDNEEDEADDLQLRLQDREGVWLCRWLNDAVQAAAEAAGGGTGMRIQAAICRKNWSGDGKDMVLDCGEFELDAIDASGPPSNITIKATSLPFSARIRQTKKSKAWEAYKLSGIAQEMAVANGMVCMYESTTDPFYARVEQCKTSDIEFLSRLCHDAGLSLKATNKILVLFDQAAYEAKGAVLTLKRGDGSYLKYKLLIGTADTQYQSCRVRYTDPVDGKLLQGTAYVADYKKDGKDNQQLEITAKVSSALEAKSLAGKTLRLHNKYARTAVFTLPGNPSIVAGVTVKLEGWGAWDGKYIVKQAKHALGNSGYTVQAALRRVLEGY